MLFKLPISSGRAVVGEKTEDGKLQKMIQFVMMEDAYVSFLYIK